MPTPAPEFVTLLGSLKKGEYINPRQLDAFMDLHRAERDMMSSEWPSIAAEKRLELMSLAAERSANDALADFSALGIVAMADEDPQVRRLAVETMSDSEDWRICDHLVKALKEDSEAIVRIAAAEGLGLWAMQVAGELLNEEQAEAVTWALRKVVNDIDEIPEVRAAALLSASVLAEDWVEGLINDFYYDEDRLLRLASVQAMGISGLEDWLDLLDEQLQSDDPDFRREAVTSVGELMIESTVDSVAALLVDDDESVVLATISALGEIGGDDATVYLKNFLEDAEPEMIEAIEEAIANATDPFNVGIDLEALEDELR